jgi:anti-sigma B factor antagonist
MCGRLRLRYRSCGQVPPPPIMGHLHRSDRRTCLEIEMTMRLTTGLQPGNDGPPSKAAHEGRRMTTRMEVRYQRLGGCLIVRVAGDVDSRGAAVLRDALVGRVSTGDTRQVVDLTRVGAMDAMGLSALLTAAHEAESSGGSMRLVGVGPSVKTVLKSADTACALMIDDDLSDALEATMEAATVTDRRKQPRMPRQSTAADLTPASRKITPR